jgi:hypothetical protein
MNGELRKIGQPNSTICHDLLASLLSTKRNLSLRRRREISGRGATATAADFGGLPQNKSGRLCQRRLFS